MLSRWGSEQLQADTKLRDAKFYLGHANTNPFLLANALPSDSSEKNFCYPKTKRSSMKLISIVCLCSLSSLVVAGNIRRSTAPFLLDKHHKILRRNPAGEKDSKDGKDSDTRSKSPSDASRYPNLDQFMRDDRTEAVRKPPHPYESTQSLMNKVGACSPCGPAPKADAAKPRANAGNAEETPGSGRFPSDV